MVAQDACSVSPSAPNFRLLKPSRKGPEAGDVFVALPADGLYVFGRVIATDAAQRSLAPLVLLYIFKVRKSVADEPDSASLAPTELLVPPITTNRQAWTRGYFQTIQGYLLDTRLSSE
jgi:hypothetical protein